VKSIHRGLLPPDDPAYKQGWSSYIGPRQNASIEKPTNSTPPDALREQEALREREALGSEPGGGIGANGGVAAKKEGPAEVRMASKRLEVNLNGESHTQGLSASGAPDLQTRLEQLHRPSTERAYREAYQ
jgi:hypothetical protein